MDSNTNGIPLVIRINLKGSPLLYWPPLLEHYVPPERRTCSHAFFHLFTGTLSTLMVNREEGRSSKVCHVSLDWTRGTCLLCSEL